MEIAARSHRWWGAAWVGLGASIVIVLLIRPLAAPAQAAFSAPMKLSATTVNGAKAAIDADGDAIAVWSHDQGATWRAQARQISSTGVLGPVKTLSAAGDKSLYPQIASEPNGGAIVVWRRVHGESRRVQARRISADGRLGPVKTISAKGRTARRPRVASDADGDAIVVWSQAQRGTWRIKARMLSSTGVLGPVKTLSSSRQNSAVPAIASDARGDAVVVWSQRGGANSPIKTLSGPVKARRISKKGQLGSVKTLSRPGHGAGFAQIASDADGDAIAVWSQLAAKRRHVRIKARRISATGTLGDVKTLSAAKSDGDSPQIASDARGDAAVVWSDFHGPGSRVQARQISPAGALGPLQTLSTRRHAYLPDVAIDSAGNATTVWTEYVSVNRNDFLLARQVSATGALGPTQTLAIAPIDQPQIAVNAEGKAFAVWSQFDGSDWSAWGALGP